MIAQETNNNNNHNHPNPNKTVHGNSIQIAEMMQKKSLIEPKSHNLLIYDDLKAFREIYSEYSKILLPENEIIVIATQYETIHDVKNTLRLSGVDVERYLNQGMLFIVDAQHGYQGADIRGIWKFAMSLLSRSKKEGRHGVSWFGDLGSFFGFEKMEEMMEYELWCPQKFEEDNMKSVCCYHSKDFEKLNEAQKQTLFDHHFKSMVVE